MVASAVEAPIIYFRDFFFFSLLMLLALSFAGQTARSFESAVDFAQSISKFPQSGPIVRVRQQGGVWQAEAGRLPTNAIDEQLNRVNNLKAFMAINLESTAAHEFLNSPIIQTMESFALSDAGAYWISRVILEDVLLFNSGYLQTKKMSDGAEYSFYEVLSGGFSEEGAARGAERLFQLEIFFGQGAFGFPGGIKLGSEGLPNFFAASGQPVDPMAVLSHEFGHTRFGDPISGASLEGERQTVLNYENPVRRLNGFADRQTYYSSELDQTIFIESGKVISGKWVHTQKESSL